MKKKIKLVCHRCQRLVPREEIMLLGCKECGGIDGSKANLAQLEAYACIGRKRKRHFGRVIF